MNVLRDAYGAPSAVAFTVSLRRVDAGAYRLPPTDHHRILLHRSAHTRSYCRTVGKYFVRRDGDIDLVPAGEAGGFEAETAFDTLEIRLAPDRFDRIAADLRVKANFETRHLLRDARVVHLARALYSDGETASPVGALFAQTIGDALAIRLLNLDERSPDLRIRLSETQLTRVREHIETNLDQPLGIDELSRIAGASSAHLRKWFKAATGFTIHRFILHRRIERARVLLSNTRLAISEIAATVGFAHQSHLTQWMRRELGTTPAQVRRRSL